MSVLKNIIYIIASKIIQTYLEEECSSKYDCFNCTFLLDCQWKNNTCINITEEKNITDISLNNADVVIWNHRIINQSSNETKMYRLFDTDNQTILFKNLKYLKNTCYEATNPFIVKENYFYDKILEKYCGKKNVIITNEMLLNGHKVQLENIDNKYGFENIICQYIIISGSYRNDVDIYINKTLSKDFFLFYSLNYNDAILINYTMTLSLDSPGLRHVSFFYYANKSFDSYPFIIYIKDYKYSSTNILDFLFLLLIIFFVVTIIVSITIVRYKSNYFNFIKNENKYKKIDSHFKKVDENYNDNKLNMSDINENRKEEYNLKKGIENNELKNDIPFCKP